MSDRDWLTRNVRVLSAVSFLQDAASELLYPLLPIYLTAVLGAPPSVVGAIEGVTGVTSMRASRAVVSGCSAVTIRGPLSPREVPSTHSA